MTYPVQFRKKVFQIKADEELSFEDVAKRFGLSKTTVFRWSKNLEPQKFRNKILKKLSKEGLLDDIEKYPDSYSYERANRLGVSPSSGIRYAMKRLKVTYKKNPKSSKSGPRKKIYILQRD